MGSLSLASFLNLLSGRDAVFQCVGTPLAAPFCNVPSGLGSSTIFIVNCYGGGATSTMWSLLWWWCHVNHVVFRGIHNNAP